MRCVWNRGRCRDGTDQSWCALEWAIGEAALHGTPLEVAAVHRVAVDNWGSAPDALMPSMLDSGYADVSPPC